MKSLFTSQRLLTGIRFVLVAIFLWSGIGKLLDSSAAQSVIEFYAWSDFGRFHSYEIIKTISVIELILAGLLIWGKYLRVALSISLVMMLFFTGTFSYLYVTGADLSDCGCFGLLAIKSSIETTILKNLILSFLIVVGFIAESKATA
jgi:uncharacterized membrane protein YphA (DoxX/SURF4 family)